MSRHASSAAPKPSQRLKTKPLSALVHGLWPTDPASLPLRGAVFAGKPQPSWVLLSDTEGKEVDDEDRCVDAVAEPADCALLVLRDPVCAGRRPRQRSPAG